MSLRRLPRYTLLFGAILLLTTLAAVFNGLSQRGLSTTEQQYVGTWTFLSPEKPTTRIVYHFDPHGQATEEHFYLTSATPDVPQLTMYGAWRVERDGQLVVEQSGGITGLANEASRQLRSMAGRPSSQFRILRRTYRLTAMDSDVLHFVVNRRGETGEYELVELTMTSVHGVQREPKFR